MAQFQNFDPAGCFHQHARRSSRDGVCLVKVVWGSLKADPLGLVTPLFSDIFTLDSRTSALAVIVCLLFPNRPLWNHRKQYRNKNTKPRLPLERREQHSHSGYDKRLLNYIKPRRSPHSAGMSPWTGEFYDPTFPLSWWHRGTKTSGDPVGHLPDSPPGCALWAWHYFPVRRHGPLCRLVFVSRNKAWKRKENNADSFSETLSLHPFMLLAGVCFVGRRR